MPILIFSREGREAIRCPLQGTFRIGRHPDNDLSLPDEGISRFHCVIEPEEGVYWLKDQSRNGTFVNGRRVEGHRLQKGDSIEIGSWRIQFGEEDWAEKETVARRVRPAETFSGMVGKSAGMKRVFGLIEKLAPLEVPVLILGETGSGKELVARALHERSSRGEQPFVAINCGAISPQLIESELFGHEKGSFTGAADRHPGAFEQARRGTLFLDEIGELPLDLQPKLLRVLEGHGFRRIGGREEVFPQCRLVAATHQDLAKKVQEKRFREDLYFRLYTLPIVIPPLREREEDIELLVGHFLRQLQPEGGKTISPSARDRLVRHLWKGNVRELKNTLLRALLLSSGSEVTEADLSFSTLEAESGGTGMEAIEREAIVKTLQETDWNKKETAQRLRIAKSTLFQKIKLYRIQKD